MFLLRDLHFGCRRTTCAKDHGPFYLNYPQSNEVGKSDHMVDKSEKKVLEEMLHMHGDGEVTFNLFDII